MKLLIYGINHAPEPIGIGKFTGEMVAWLAARGHDVRVISAPPYYPAWRVGEGYSAWRWRRETIDGARVYRCPLYVPSRPRGLSRVLHLASFALASLPVALAQVLLFRPDVLIAIAPPITAAPGARFAAALGRAPAWLHIQDFEIDAAFALGLVSGGGMRRFALAVESWLLRRFAAVSSITPAMVARLAEKGVAPDRRLLFPNWVDTSAIRPGPSALRAELGLPHDAVVALYSGNMGEKQGVETLAEVADRLANSKVHLVLAGAGAARPRLEAATGHLTQVHWLPIQPAERLNDMLNAADIHLLPQRADAADLVMPSKLAFMLASGRPVVAGASPGTAIAKAVEGCGRIVGPGDGAAMAEAVRELAGNPQERRRLGEAARARAIADWDREEI
ncbi:MAG: colanic acid biosynthesis glycosyl transferase WcaI, partial [Rhodospirillaceae bacterium]|nr:colanic acid biosynthesis glycosyl transferase WcaI [Rhodospirillaceae bacterium]